MLADNLILLICSPLEPFWAVRAVFEAASEAGVDFGDWQQKARESRSREWAQIWVANFDGDGLDEFLGAVERATWARPDSVLVLHRTQVSHTFVVAWPRPGEDHEV